MQNKLAQQESTIKKLSSEHKKLSSSHRELSSNYNELTSDNRHLLNRMSFLEKELSIVMRHNSQLQNQLSQEQSGIHHPVLGSQPIKMSIRPFHGSPSIDEPTSGTNSFCGELTNIEGQIRNVQVPAQVRQFNQSRFQPSETQPRFHK